MPTVFTHPVAAAALAPAVGAHEKLRLLGIAALCTVLPDLDMVMFWFGIPYEHPLGHRGFSHSLVFAALVAFVLARLFFRPERRGAVGLYLFAATASHPLLDMLTNGGLGVALFSPFTNARLFFPWRPIAVSPFGLEFFSERGAAVVLSELAWVWAPSALLGLALLVWRRRRDAKAS